MLASARWIYASALRAPRDSRNSPPSRLPRAWTARRPGAFRFAESMSLSLSSRPNDRACQRRSLHQMRRVRRRLSGQCLRFGARRGPDDRPHRGLPDVLPMRALLPADALYVSPFKDERELVDEAALIARGLLGSYRRALGWRGIKAAGTERDLSHRLPEPDGTPHRTLTPPANKPVRLAIIGGGFTGAAFAIHALKTASRPVSIH